jgi:CcmD family protein
MKFKSFLYNLLLNLTWIMLLIPVSGQAQAMDFLRSTGKIYTVVVVIAIIFIGLAIYLIRLDNKLTKLENHIKNEQ